MKRLPLRFVMRLLEGAPRYPMRLSSNGPPQVPPKYFERTRDPLPHPSSESESINGVPQNFYFEIDSNLLVRKLLFRVFHHLALNYFAHLIYWLGIHIHPKMIDMSRT